MGRLQFHRTILDDYGVIYNLPTAMYYSYGNGLTAVQVRELADQAATSVGRAYWVLVSQFENLAWRLPPANPVSLPLPNVLSDTLRSLFG
jgi:hypothetical protein